MRMRPRKRSGTAFITSERAGIAIIHQELALFPEMSVGENLFLGVLPQRLHCLAVATGVNAQHPQPQAHLVRPQRRVGFGFQSQVASAGAAIATQEAMNWRSAWRDGSCW